MEEVSAATVSAATLEVIVNPVLEPGDAELGQINSEVFP
ncbi:hypothetical protein GFS31_34530 [Leptolyngbya sp. BL0902]|nr:hypothetical protein GFS31_34530 [Leptolyngbya sp. BL0902]